MTDPSERITHPCPACGCTSTGEGKDARCDGDCDEYTEPQTPENTVCSECGCSQPYTE